MEGGGSLGTEACISGHATALLTDGRHFDSRVGEVNSRPPLAPWRWGVQGDPPPPCASRNRGWHRGESPCGLMDGLSPPLDGGS